jgi:cyanuric acid amidohydrolase
MTVRVHCFDMDGAGDVARLDAWLATLDLARLRRLVVLAKTEGHHAPNDFSRDLLKLRLAACFDAHGISDRAMSMLTIGCEGVGSPKGFAFASLDTPPVDGPARLALGFARSDVVPVAEIGTVALVDRAAGTVRAAMADAGLAPGEVRLAFVKTPLLPARHPLATPKRSTMHRGRAISALAGGVALGEVDRARVTEDGIATDLGLYARHVQAVTGAEIDRVEAIVMGNRPGAGGDLYMAATHTRDILDQRSIRAMLIAHGIRFDEAGELLDGERIEALICKAMVDESGEVRGSRTTVYSSGWAPESHIRSAYSGVLGSLLGHLRFYVSADAVHQAPPGGGVVAAVLRAQGSPDSVSE